MRSRPVERRLRRAWAEARFHARGLRVLVRPTLGLAACLAVGTFVLHGRGAAPGGEAPRWDEAAYLAWYLLLGEMGGPLPEDGLAQALVYVMPLFGVLFLAEGVLKLGFTVFRKRDNQEAWTRIMADTSRGHVILVGLGHVGFRVLEELLALGEQVFAVEKDEHGDFVAKARGLGVEVVVGDARHDDVVRSLNVERARAVVIATNDDLANLEIAMDVREVRADVPIVLRLFDQRLAQKVRPALGVDVTLSTSAVSAPLLASAALDRRVVGAHRIGDRRLVVVEVVAGRDIAGRTVADVHRERGFVVVAVRHEDADWIVEPRPDEPVVAGDRVQLLVPGEKVEVACALSA
ncbi:MAG: potassium channel family protein [Myxococcota bacterium]